MGMQMIVESGNDKAVIIPETFRHIAFVYVSYFFVIFEL